MQTIRCSSLPRFLKCASSEAEVPVVLEGTSPAADLGTACHEIMAALVEGKNYDVATTADIYGVDGDELSRLVYYGKEAWAYIEPFLVEPKAEVPVEGELIRGTADVVSIGDSYTVVDWKSGYVESNSKDQVTGYLSCLRHHHGVSPSGTYTGTVVWLRHGTMDTYELDDVGLDHFEDRVSQQMGRIGTHYSPDEDTCHFCRRRLECVAYQQFIRGAALAIADSGTITPAGLVALYPRAKALKQALADYDSALRMVLQRGAQALPEGREIRLVERNRRSVRPKKAWPILVERGYSDSDLSDCVTMSLSKVTKLAMDNAAPGQKTAAKEELIEALEEAGAIEHAAYTTLEIGKARS